MIDVARDPRYRPETGDVLVQGDQTRHVLSVLQAEGGKRVDRVVFRRRVGGPARSCTLSAWHRWAKDAEVVSPSTSEVPRG